MKYACGWILTVILTVLFFGVVSVSGEAIAGSISGQVVADSDGTPISDAWVDVSEENGAYSDSVYTEADGTYQITSLPAGNYRVQIYSPPTPYVGEYYDNSFDYGSATLVPVTLGTEKANIDFGLAVGGSISGMVTTDADGAPIADVSVSACDDSIGCLYGYTLADGTYQITSLPAGNYRVQIYSPPAPYVGEYYDNSFDYESATLVPVSLGQEIVNIDFGLAVSGSISGQVVTDAEGTPIADASVNACPENGGNCGWASTQADGTYQVSGLAAGSYRVGVSASAPYLHEYYDNTLDYESATLVPVSLGQEAANINFGLAVGGSISGQVVADADGTPVSDAWVDVSEENGAYGASVYTEADGTYRITSLPAGNYRVQIYSPPAPYLGEYYDNSFDYGSATLVPVSLGEEIVNIDFGLAVSGSISGQVVTDAEGTSDRRCFRECVP